MCVRYVGWARAIINGLNYCDNEIIITIIIIIINEVNIR